MARIESGVTVARPVDQVFQFLLDLDKNHTDPTVEPAVKVPNGPTGPGTEFRFRHSKGPKETSMRYTAVEPGKKIEFKGNVGPLRPSGAFEFAEGDGGTRLTVDVTANPVGPLKLLSPVVNRVGQRIWDARLTHIKEALESEKS